MKKALSFLLIVLICLPLLTGCADREKEKGRDKPLLSCLSIDELKKTLGELYVFVPPFWEHELSPDETLIYTENIRLMEYCIDYTRWASSDSTDYFTAELRRAVELYYGGELPGIKYYAVAGSPRYAQTGVKLSDLDDAEFLSALKEHFFGNVPGFSPEVTTIRGFVEKLEENADADYKEVYPPENADTTLLNAEELIVEELRRAVKLYYGIAPYDKPAERPNIFGEDGEKTKLSEMDGDTLRAVLCELGVLELFFDERYSEEMLKAIESYEYSKIGGPASGPVAESFMHDEIYRAVKIYYSDIYPFGN